MSAASGRRAGAPQRPEDEKRLEEQPEEPPAIGVEQRRRAPGAPLVNVAGEDSDEERRDRLAHARTLLRKRHERSRERDLHDP